MSRRNIGIILLVSFIAIAVFGFIAMGGGSGHAHGGCIAATANGLPSCPGSGENTESLLFHIQTFKSFSQALIGATLLLVGLFLAARSSQERLISDEPKAEWACSCARVIRLAQLWQKTRQRIIYWLALHESRADVALMGA
ncbi:hypothetical protein HYW17_05645 [Candidatus Uhrbacteria bacterium]|nr:hypothetical protein [Candidatus Uhrbacteria bacterium]